MNTDVWIWAALIAAAVLLYYFYAKMGRFFRGALLGAFTGLFALGVLWVAGHFFELAVKITPFTVAVSALLGVPGVLGLLLLPVL